MNATLEQLAARLVELVSPVAGVADPGSDRGAQTPGAPTPATGSPTPATGPDPAGPPAPPPPVAAVDRLLKGYDLDVRVPSSAVVAVARILDETGFALDAVTGVDWLAHTEMEVVYDYFHPTTPLRVVVRTRIPRTEPELATISEVFPGANWHERETHDFFGIRFVGHPNLKPFLLPEDADFHPLRKDYQP